MTPETGFALDDLIECGVDLCNPVQTVLKERFGEQLIFYGGVFDAVSLATTTSPVFTICRAIYRKRIWMQSFRRIGIVGTIPPAGKNVPTMQPMN